MGLMLSRTDAYEHQISTLSTQLQAAEKSIKDLQTRLDDLVQSKKEHENMLLGSFAQVLNEKKLKIRNQQRLLASANVDSDKGMLSLHFFLI
jgi:prefoldin subunit 5